MQSTFWFGEVFDLAATSQCTYPCCITDEEHGAHGSTHNWCRGIPLLQLLHQADYAYPDSQCQNLVCSAVNNQSYAAHYSLGAAAVAETQGIV